MVSGSALGPAHVRHDGERAGAHRRTDRSEGESVKGEKQAWKRPSITVEELCFLPEIQNDSAQQRRSRGGLPFI